LVLRRSHGPSEPRPPRPARSAPDRAVSFPRGRNVRHGRARAVEPGSRRPTHPETPAMRPTLLTAALLALIAAPVTAQPSARRPGAPHLTTAEVRTAEHVYKQTPQGDLTLHFYLPPDWKPSDKRPAVVFFFGGGWKNGSFN